MVHDPESGEDLQAIIRAALILNSEVAEAEFAVTSDDPGIGAGEREHRKIDMGPF